MPSPNKTVAKFRQRNPFPARERRADAFTDWLAEQANKGARFDTIEQAREAFVKEAAK